MCSNEVSRAFQCPNSVIWLADNNFGSSMVGDPNINISGEDIGGGDCDCDDGNNGRMRLAEEPCRSCVHRRRIIIPKLELRTWHSNKAGCGGNVHNRRDDYQADRRIKVCSGAKAGGGGGGGGGVLQRHNGSIDIFAAGTVFGYSSRVKY